MAEAARRAVLGASVVLVHASAPPVVAGDFGAAGTFVATSSLALQTNQEWQALAKKWVAKARRRAPIESVVREGIPWRVVLDEAKRSKAKLVVVGSHGRTGLRRLAVGSVAEAVVRHSKVPMLVVPQN